MKTRQLKPEEINAIRAGLELLRRTMENGEDLEPVAHHLYNPDGGNCLDDDEIGVLDGELEGAVVFVGGARAQG